MLEGKTSEALYCSAACGNTPVLSVSLDGQFDPDDDEEP